MVKDNPLIKRIRGVRHEISAEYHHDPKKLIEHLIELEKKHSTRFINPGYFADQKQEKRVPVH